MKNGVGSFVWKISVALYLIANGVLGLQKYRGSDFYIIFNRMGFGRDALSAFVMAASVIALVAGFCILLEMLKVRISFLDTLLLIIAIIWLAYVAIEVVAWITKGKSENTFSVLQMLAVHLMVLGSLLIASKKFG
jgi:hypothetical protein